MSSYTAKEGDTECCVAVIRKAGSLSIDYVLSAPHFDAVKALTFPVRVAFIRHPIERLKSAYRFFVQYPVESVNVSDGWHSFVDWALDVDPQNEHWNLQGEQVGPVVNQMYRFEDIHKHWLRMFGVKIPHTNVSREQKTNDYRQADIVQHFKQDLELWHSL